MPEISYYIMMLKFMFVLNAVSSLQNKVFTYSLTYCLFGM